MISVTKAQELIDQHAGPISAETLSLASLQGRVLREPVAAAEDMPAFDRSAMDGYAIRADDVAADFDIIAEIRAGQAIDRELQPGQAVRIFTGARLPGPGLQVIMQEHVEARDGRMRITKRVPGTNIRLRGEDARAGEILLEPGAALDATAIALLASIGKTSVLVSPQPRILHLTTGDEIISPEQTPAEGQIRNSNAALIAGLCRECGAEAIDHYHTSDNLAAMKEVLFHSTEAIYDLILISGGSGNGAYDFTAELFRHLRATIHFREVNVRPGKPLIFGTVSRTARLHKQVEGFDPSRSKAETEMTLRQAENKGWLENESYLPGPQIVFGLPGNALSHFVCFHLFVRRALARLFAKPAPMTTQGFLSAVMPGTNNTRETWWPARAGLNQGRLECRALAWKSSGDITRLPGANALIYVPASTSHLDAGTMVELLPTRHLSSWK